MAIINFWVCEYFCLYRVFGRKNHKVFLYNFDETDKQEILIFFF